MHYLTGSLLLFLIWAIIFTLKKNLRKEMIIASLITTPAAFSEVLFVPNYWLPDAIMNPKLSIEDFIFSFAIGGIVASLYELVMGKNIYHQRLCECFQNRKAYLLILGLGIVVVLASYFIFRLNFMYSTYLGIFTDIVLIAVVRSDLLVKIIFSSALFGVFYTTFFALFSLLVPTFINHWNFSTLSGYTFFKVPVEEIIWAFGIGGLLGPIYEYLLGLSLIQEKS